MFTKTSIVFVYHSVCSCLFWLGAFGKNRLCSEDVYAALMGRFQARLIFSTLFSWVFRSCCHCENKIRHASPGSIHLRSCQAFGSRLFGATEARPYSKTAGWFHHKIGPQGQGGFDLWFENVFGDISNCVNVGAWMLLHHGASRVSGDPFHWEFFQATFSVPLDAWTASFQL